jgi:hypothetical protein
MADIIIQNGNQTITITNDNDNGGPRPYTQGRLQGMTNDELVDLINDTNGNSDTHNRALQELVRRLIENAKLDNDCDSQDDLDKLQKIMKKLKNGEPLSESEKGLLERLVPGLNLGGGGCCG